MFFRLKGLCHGFFMYWGRYFFKSIQGLETTFFKLAIRFHPDYSWPEALIRSFSELVE